MQYADSHRWPWAALQGASLGKGLGTNLTEAILAISGEELVYEELANKADYCMTVEYC